MNRVPPRLVRIREVMSRTGLSRSHIYYLIEHGRFPKGIKLAEKAVAWREDDVDRWVDARIQIASQDRPRGPGRPRKNPWLAPVT